jgi:ABC-type bacteriocin/lantibiotic exporter with double-glycine peptidase domain
LGLFLIFSILSAIAEGVTIAAMLPFISILSGDTKFHGLDISSRIKDIISADPKVLITILFVLAVILAVSFRIIYIWISNVYCYQLGGELSTMMFSNLLNAPYETQKLTNLSEALSTLTSKSSALVSGLIQPVINIVSNVVTGSAIFAALLFIQPKVVLWTSAILICSYVLISIITKKKMQKFGKLIADSTTNNVKIIQESLNLYKYIKILQDEKYTISKYEENILEYQINCAKVQIAILLPKQLIEALAILLMTGVVFLYIYDGGNLSVSAGIFGAMALGTQRLLPLAQQIYANAMTIKAMHQNVLDSLDYLEVHRISKAKKISISVRNLEIEYESISYRFPDKKKNIFESINLNVKIGDRIAITGSTGSGKSTLTDILIGLLPPTDGKIRLNGKFLSGNELLNIANICTIVPQQIYLKNDTIRSNIILNGNNTDEDRLQAAVMAAGLAEFIESLPSGLETAVGERSAMLSGGQSQRIGIARALYLERPILILDEATNALDKVTERLVLANIVALYKNKIIFIISHDEINLDICNKIIKL